MTSASQDISQPPDNGFEEELYAAAAVLIDASNNRILYEHNAKKAYPMASTTKIMTLVIALEYGNDSFMKILPLTSMNTKTSPIL